MLIYLKKIINIFKGDLVNLLNYLTFSSPNISFFNFLRKWLVKKRFNNFGATSLLIGPNIKVYYPKNIKLKGYVALAEGIYLDARGGLEIGDYSGIATGTFIRTEAHNYADPDIPFQKQGHTLKPVRIGDDVWIANNCFILPGTHIDNGAIIAACSVVSGYVPPYSIMAGNPARKIGTRKKAEINS